MHSVPYIVSLLVWGLCLASALALHSTPSAGHLSWHPPEFCGDLPCPRYTVWQKNLQHQWEARRYRPAVWLTITMPVVWNYHAAVTNASTRLWSYFWGANEEGLRMQETVPLTVTFKTDLPPHVGHDFNYTVSAFLPENFHVRVAACCRTLTQGHHQDLRAAPDA